MGRRCVGKRSALSSEVLGRAHRKKDISMFTELGHDVSRRHFLKSTGAVGNIAVLTGRDGKLLIDVGYAGAVPNSLMPWLVSAPIQPVPTLARSANS